MEPLDIVKQTGKTIVFEEFDSSKDDLVTFLTRSSEELHPERFVREALEPLSVKSFEEFVKKFAPVIYETVVKTGENSANFVYELEKPGQGQGYTEISLKDHAFYKMIMNLLNRKSLTDKGNFDFPYDDLKKALMPESEMAECKKLRKNLESNTREYLRLTADGMPPSIRVNQVAGDIQVCLEKIVSKYKNKSPLGLLPLFIADRQQMLDKMSITDGDDEQSETAAAIPAYYSFDDRGNLELKEASVSDESDAPLAAIEAGDEDKGLLMLTAAVSNDFKEFAPPAVRENEYVKDLVVSVFTPAGKVQVSSQNKRELEESKKIYQDVYKKSLESFAKAVSAVVEKFAGMKAFFDHASCEEGNLPNNVSVIIANCKPERIINDPVARERFEKYFTALSNEKDVNKIWFGIIPGIAYGTASEADMSSSADEVINPFMSRGSKKDKKIRKSSDLTTLESAKAMLDLLSRVRIMTFTNYKASEQTGFLSLTAQQVRDFQNDFDSVQSEYGVFVYPNFTVLPAEKSAVKIGTEYNFEKEREEIAYASIPGIYIESSYVACGMMVGIQNYRLLKSKKFEVNPKYPSVRFDLEEGDNAKIIVSKMNRETTTEIDSHVRQAIMEDRFGFVFADNKIIYDNKVINNSYVINARTLLRDKNGKFKNIYKTLLKNLVNQLLHSASDIITDNVVQKFCDTDVKKWIDDNRDSKSKNWANRILHDGEKISLDKDSHKIYLSLNEVADVWDDVIIEEKENTSESGE